MINADIGVATPLASTHTLIPIQDCSQADTCRDAGVTPIPTAMAATDQIDAAIALLERSGQYKILRKLCVVQDEHLPAISGCKIGLILDVETTGLDHTTDEIIELAMVPFVYSDDGVIHAVGPTWQQLNQPSTPIPAKITQLTGIDDAMVHGHHIDPLEVAMYLESASVVVAHNAKFDRPFSERLCPAFAALDWACSLADVDWSANGFESGKLAMLLMEIGRFHDRHRAGDDGLAVLTLLQHRLEAIDKQPALAVILEAAHKTTMRVWARNSAFEKKDILKRRGYRWHPGNSAHPKSWFIDVAESDLACEVAFLQMDIFGYAAHIDVETITARERYSDR